MCAVYDRDNSHAATAFEGVAFVLNIQLLRQARCTPVFRLLQQFILACLLSSYLVFFAV